MVAKTVMRMVVFRKLSGRRAGCGDPGCPTATDDPGLVLSKVKVVAVSHSAGFPRKRAISLAMSLAVCVDKELGGPSGTWRLSNCTPCRDKSFRKAVSAVMDNLGTDGKIIE